MASTTTIAIPIDVVEEILQKIALKSIIRFKCVSKQWKTSIESHSFIDRHRMDSSRRRKILLAFGCRDHGDYSPPFLFPEEEDEDEVKEEEICYIGNCDASRISLTCDGLICIPGSDSIEVCNPATRVSRRFPTGESLVSNPIFLHKGTGGIPAESLVHRQRYLEHEHVPKFPTAAPSSFGFGKDEVTGAYKVVELRAHPRSSLIVGECNVLDLQTGRWRHVNIVPYKVFARERSVYVNGSLHWFTVDLWEPNASRIVAFDLHLEEIRVVSHPNPIYSSDDGGTPYFSELLLLRDRLSVSEMRTTNVPHPRLDIWSMLDAVKQGWVKMHSLCLCQLYRPRSSETRLFTPLVILDDDQGDGGLLIVWDYQESLFMSYPKNFLLNKVSAYARVVASSYFQTLVPVP
ncbi:PREDICTED: F-box/LRR-repeat protein At2g43260-like [Camelina sativa]|uniref:F-box/LRR-repeat protein At2g43260-like n=1 Tax=Camelina sativa TaxID=90675 RepID=A0ABM0VMV1_CAMSA|nr:PREDICTED: F-box/LRR-repeat protein At2g43260-like [Camelina sativa]